MVIQAFPKLLYYPNELLNIPIFFSNLSWYVNFDIPQNFIWTDSLNEISKKYLYTMLTYAFIRKNEL